MESPFRAHPACQQDRHRPACALKLKTPLGFTMTAPVPCLSPASQVPCAHSSICSMGVWGCADQPREFSAQGKCVLTCRIMSFSLHGCISSHLRSERTCSCSSKAAVMTWFCCFFLYNFFCCVLSTESDNWIILQDWKVPWVPAQSRGNLGCVEPYGEGNHNPSGVNWPP